MLEVLKGYFGRVLDWVARHSELYQRQQESFEKLEEDNHLQSIDLDGLTAGYHDTVNESIDLSDRLHKEFEGTQQTLEALRAKNTELMADYQKAVSQIGDLVEASIGERRRTGELEKEVGTVGARLERTQRALKRMTKRVYDEGPLKKKAVLVCDMDSVVITPNLTARNLLRGYMLTGVRLSDFFSISDDKPQIRKIGGDYYSFEVSSINDGYVVEVSKNYSDFFRRSKSPYGKNITELCLKRIDVRGPAIA